jgi:hypothetical protein
MLISATPRKVRRSDVNAGRSAVSRGPRAAASSVA